MVAIDIQNIIINYLRNYDPVYVGLFGSFARGDWSRESDIDILVLFKSSYSLLQLIRIENELSDRLGHRVDLITEGSIKNNRVKQSIQQDLKIIYQA